MIVNFFWHGGKLGRLEHLTLASFCKQGHKAHLWAYQPLHVNWGIPGLRENLTVLPAGDILDPGKVFTYTGNGDCSVGSLGGFSDIFRYYLLNQVGGWYCDMDVTCLTSFADLDQYPIILRPHHKTGVVANILKLPAGHSIFRHLIEETQAQVTQANSRWILPVEIFSKHARCLSEYITPVEYFGNDSPTEIERYITENYFLASLPKYAIHWCHTAITTGRWQSHHLTSVHDPSPLTVLYNLYQQHDIPQ